MGVVFHQVDKVGIFTPKSDRYRVAQCPVKVALLLPAIKDNSRRPQWVDTFTLGPKNPALLKLLPG